MATTEEMSLCRKVLQLGMIITAQGKHKIHVDYAGHVDVLSVWSDDPLDGWSACQHDCYLGDFYQQTWHGKNNREGAKKLEALINDMESLISRDEDGIPV